MGDKTPRLLSSEQRLRFNSLPTDLSAREMACYYTLTPADIEVINSHRRPHNRLGFAVQLCLLRFPGRPLADVEEIPERVLSYIAAQLQLDPAAFGLYGQRDNTRYEHLDEIREVFGFRNCGWRETLQLARVLRQEALASDRPLALIETALEFLRVHQIIAPGITTVERLVWGIQRMADRRVERLLNHALTETQHQELEKVFHHHLEKTDKTNLGWLREAPKTPSASSLSEVLKRLAFVTDMELPPIPTNVHHNRILQLAQRCNRYQAQPLSRFPAPYRHTLLFPYLSELSQDLVDQALDMFDKIMGEVIRRGERRQDKHWQQHARSINRNLMVLTTAAEALLRAKTEALEPFTTVFSAVEEQTLAAVVASAKGLARPPDMDSLDLIETKYERVRSVLLAMYQALQFAAVRGADPSLQALNYAIMLFNAKRRVKFLTQTLKSVRYSAPLMHVTDRWLRHVIPDSATVEINPNYYEASAFELLKTRLRSGDIYVEGSRHHRPFDSYLLPRTEWQQLSEAGLTQLAVTEDADSYLNRKQAQIQALLTDVNSRVAALPGLSLDAAGKLHLGASEQEEVALDEATLALEKRVYAALPRIPLADLLIEVDSWTGFLGQMTHLTLPEAPQGERKAVLLAALMALGMNLGLGKMADSTPFSYRQLFQSAEWHVREETLTKAEATLDNFVLRQPLSRLWGDGTSSSSDGMRVPVRVRAANAERNARYFGTGRGVTIYTHVADIWLPFAQRVISTNDREALHVIDALCHHETELDIQEHYTDTAGYTEHVFALCALLGFRFAPRIRNVLGQQLFTIGRADGQGPVMDLVKGRISKKAIRDQWDEMLRLATSIKHGTTSASLLMRRLAGYRRQNQLAKALGEVGRIEKTIFILEYLRDEGLRRRVHLGLNKGEALHALARALFFGQGGELWDRDFQDQLRRASALHVLMAAIATWNTVYLSHALPAVNLLESDANVSHISPLRWEHINFLGRYSFDFHEARPLQNLRPLRTEAEIELTAGEDNGPPKIRYRRRR